MQDPLTPWEHEKVYSDGDQFFSDLSHAMVHARQSIDLETYIFLKDPLGLQVLEQLKAATSRGVRVRLLLDGVGCSSWTAQDILDLKKDGIELRYYHPLPWQLTKFSFWKMMKPNRIFLGFSKLNRRNHRKTCIVDHRTAFVGGMNVSAVHRASYSGREAWRDSSIRIEGPSVHHLSQAFELAWNHPMSATLSSRERKLLPVREDLLRLNVTSKQRWLAYRDLVGRVLRAKSRVWITNPYFVPDRTLVRALRLVALSGTDVRILVPHKSDVFAMEWAVKAFYLVLLSSGVRIFEYIPAVLHAKTVIIDDWATIGSSNLNHRSLFHDLEVDVVLTQKRSLAQVEQQFIEDLSKSREIQHHQWKLRPHTQKLLERMALMFRKWL